MSEAVLVAPGCPDSQRTAKQRTGAALSSCSASLCALREAPTPHEKAHGRCCTMSVRPVSVCFGAPLLQQVAMRKIFFHEPFHLSRNTQTQLDKSKVPKVRQAPDFTQTGSCRQEPSDVSAPHDDGLKHPAPLEFKSGPAHAQVLKFNSIHSYLATTNRRS